MGNSFRPSIMTVITLLVVMAVQVGIEYHQSFYGPRKFIPKRLLPPKFNYFITLPINIDLEAQEEDNLILVDCAICMTNIYEKEAIQFAEDNYTPDIFRRITDESRRQIMKTPCGH